MNNTLKRILLVTAVLIGLLVVYAGFVSLGRLGKTKVQISIAPSVATITLDNKPVNNGVFYLKSGSHRLVASYPNFSTESKNFSASDQDLAAISISLNPLNQKAEDFLKANPVYQLQREAVGGQELSGRALVNSTPIIKLLPRTSIDDYYRIDYESSPSDKTRARLLISNSSPNGRQNALQWIKQQGYDPAELEIIFSDFQNPLKGPNQ